MTNSIGSEAFAVSDALVTPILLLSAILLSPLPQYIVSLWTKGRRQSRIPQVGKEKIVNKDVDKQEQPAGFIVPAQIHHARMLPRESQHSFRYPSLYFAVELHALEHNAIDCRAGFSWSGGTSENKRQQSRWSVTRFHPMDFGRKTFADALSPQSARIISASMLLKLAYELRHRGYIRKGPQDVTEEHLINGGTNAPQPWDQEIGQVWAIAMPTVFGLAGFNPLTVYYVYRPSTTSDESRGAFWLAVLEVHNTFNERHMYVCEVGKGQGGERLERRGYDYTWTFARDFHVSPFNDRLGYYQLFLGDMWGRDDKSSRQFGTNNVPNIDVRLLLLVPPEDGEQVNAERPLQKKLLATLASSTARSATQTPSRGAQPLTTTSVLTMLLRQPFDLFLPVARIMWEAAKLHWKKRLPVHIRPEPHGEASKSAIAKPSFGRNSANEMQPMFDSTGWPNVHNPVERRDDAQSSGDIYWNDETFIDRTCKQAVHDWLIQFTSNATDQSVLIKHRSPELEDTLYWQGRSSKEEKAKSSLTSPTLTLFTFSPALFVDLCLYVPAHARLFGSQVERAWAYSSSEQFTNIFERQTDVKQVQRRQNLSNRIVLYLRVCSMRWATSEALHAMRANGELDQHKRCAEIASRLVDQAGGPHPLDEMACSYALVFALFLHVLALIVTAGASKLLRVRYVRHPWAQVGEGLILLSQHSHL